MSLTQLDWYKDAVIYELHIKAFFDGNNDGIGDFPGLLQKLDYIQELGVTAVWVLPFYPSPLRDDGYDIAEYRDVNPTFGTLSDFRRFVKAAHQRGLRVITELVLNHTSDQHNWFQRARHAKRGTAHRNYYVWSETDQKYRDTRIIFLDTESSNWAWDPVAQEYYWHRFYSHQPDLNFDNPRVMTEVLGILRFWMGMGVDGLRLDAIPYLVEREGTRNENLPETHAILKRIRAELDQKYPGRVLLAEANQWPEDVLPYFGNGDECHMAFHFPVMPRMYMAIAQEDRHPIADILRQTPDIPLSCQWGIFLRNHDELTLEMVTDKERDYLWEVYASDKRMRLNLGIRRRLAPLLENDRRKIELMNSLLLSLPGTPIIYYGDEIGMGDNVLLGDRDGVRTPMQWSPDRNGGFSRADPNHLFLPPVMDPIYGFGAVNVEAQQRSPSSLLNWMKRMITIRQSHKAFGRGSLRLLYPRNRKVLAYLREYEGEVILCLVCLSRSAQAVELDLSGFKGRVPLELIGNSPFPPVGDLPYLFTLPGHGFYWFTLAEETAMPSWHTPIPEPLPDFITMVMRHGWSALFDGQSARDFRTEVLPAFLAKQRWFSAREFRILEVNPVNWAELADEEGTHLLLEVEVRLDGVETPRRYFLPLSVSFDEQALNFGWPLLSFSLARVRQSAQVGALYDAMAGVEFPLKVFERMRGGVEIAASSGTVRFSATTALSGIELPPGVEVKRLGVEQSNSSVMISDIAVIKAYRQLAPGVQPEIEIGRFLVEEAAFANVAPLLGTVEHIDESGASTALAAAFGYVRNQGDGWVYTIDYLQRVLDELFLVASSSELDQERQEYAHSFYLAQAKVLGRRTAEMHMAFAVRTENPAFRAEPISRADTELWSAAAERQAYEAFLSVERALSHLSVRDRALAERVLDQRDGCLAAIRRFGGKTVHAVKTRVHGDYHLAQVLVAQNDFYIVDFEGEAARSLEERRTKWSPLKDVAGMLRSFDYAAWSAASHLGEVHPGREETILALSHWWRDATVQAFLDSYREAIAGCPSYPESASEARALLNLFLLEKSLYEVCYEAANRPGWLRIPLKGVAALMKLDIADVDQHHAAS